jgi:hypothetical protein
MGTRIDVLLDHNLTDYRDREAVLTRLATALPSALAVQDYWHSADPHSIHDKSVEWRAEAMSPHNPVLYRYTAPGSLFLTVTNQAAHIRTGGRWRGFLSIEPLRRVHLTAFRHITRALGSSSLAIYADACEIDNSFWGGKTQGECVALMERLWGPPQRSVEGIESWIATEAERTVPQVWFLERSGTVDSVQ